MGRAPCCEKVGLKKGRWTAEEDEILMKFIAAHGEGSWRSLPKNAGLLRCGKSCRLRWINYLRADLKRGNISQQEEETIIKLQASLGNRWSVIAGHLPGRTDNEIKNYWNSHLSRKLHSFGQTGGGDGEPVAVDLSKVASKRKGGRPAGKPAKKKQTNNESMRSRENEKGESITSSVTFGLQSEVLGSNEELDCSEFLGANEDSGVMSSSESGAHVVNEEGEGGAKVGGELDGVEKWVDWEEGLWNGVGEMWPWGWDGGISEVLEVQGMEGDVYPYQLEGSSLDSYWL